MLEKTGRKGPADDMESSPTGYGFVPASPEKSSLNMKVDQKKNQEKR
ncbi:hypothetical protein [Neobacillus notoginsengisoli]|nr:hypothetical protein [Neobacillus notoginsengisoli]